MLFNKKSRVGSTRHRAWRTSEELLKCDLLLLRGSRSIGTVAMVIVFRVSPLTRSPGTSLCRLTALSIFCFIRLCSSWGRPQRHHPADLCGAFPSIPAASATVTELVSCKKLLGKADIRPLVPDLPETQFTHPQGGNNSDGMCSAHLFLSPFLVVFLETIFLLFLPLSHLSRTYPCIDFHTAWLIHYVGARHPRTGPGGAEVRHKTELMSYSLVVDRHRLLTSFPPVHCPHGQTQPRTSPVAQTQSTERIRL